MTRINLVVAWQCCRGAQNTENLQSVSSSQARHEQVTRQQTTTLHRSTLAKSLSTWLGQCHKLREVTNRSPSCQTTSPIGRMLFHPLMPPPRPCYFGLPEQLLSDLGMQFLPQLMTELCCLWRVDQTLTTLWHPQSKEAVERGNIVLGDALKALLLYLDQGDWDVVIPQLLRAFLRHPTC